MIAENKRLTVILLIVIFLLLIPFIAMQFTYEVNWKGSDFVVMGIMLLSAGFACELVLRKIKKASHRMLLCAAALVLFILIWLELAVGIFGTRFAGS